ncbi:MAG: hypothetical protein LBK43_04030 [Treponema sp.]|jgi:hypothetical protein|nr:hypothetical protein [Treponema sp.]
MTRERLPNIFIDDTDNNKFIGYVDLYKRYPELHIRDIYIYEKYIVLEELFQNEKNWYIGGFSVYKYNKEFKYSEYQTRGKKLYSKIGDPYWFKGISDDLLFCDIGTGPWIRGIDIFDLANNDIVLEGNYYRRFWLSGNILYGLVFSQWNVKRANFDDYLVQMYYKYFKMTEKPEEKEEYKWLFQEFILNYNYNILTKEITNLSGEYMFNKIEIEKTSSKEAVYAHPPYSELEIRFA